jgi:hypothetical protein
MTNQDLEMMHTLEEEFETYYRQVYGHVKDPLGKIKNESKRCFFAGALVASLQAVAGRDAKDMLDEASAVCDGIMAADSANNN